MNKSLLIATILMTAGLTHAQSTGAGSGSGSASGGGTTTGGAAINNGTTGGSATSGSRTGNRTGTTTNPNMQHQVPPSQNYGGGINAPNTMPADNLNNRVNNIRGNAGAPTTTIPNTTTTLR